MQPYRSLKFRRVVRPFPYATSCSPANLQRHVAAFVRVLHPMIHGPDRQVAHDVLRARMVGELDPEVETLEPEPACDSGEIESDRHRLSDSRRGSWSPALDPFGPASTPGITPW